MDISLSDDQVMLQDMTRRFVEDRTPIAALRRLADRGEGYDPAVWREGAEPDIGLDRVVTHRIGGGTQEMQLNLVAERHLGLPREPSFDKDVPFNELQRRRKEAAQ